MSHMLESFQFIIGCCLLCFECSVAVAVSVWDFVVVFLVFYGNIDAEVAVRMFCWPVVVFYFSLFCFVFVAVELLNVVHILLRLIDVFSLRGKTHVLNKENLKISLNISQNLYAVFFAFIVAICSVFGDVFKDLWFNDCTCRFRMFLFFFFCFSND